jgi:drug/metabolite transporter (DMT)-like permease
MVELLLGIVAAAGASTFYSLGVALQAMDAKLTPSDDHLRLALIRDLVKHTRWLLGTGLSLLGWPLQLLALSLAPLVVVQPAMAAGLLVLLAISERMLGERAGRREHLAVVAIVIGVVGTALCAPPRTTTHASWQVLTVVLVVLGLASLLPYILSRYRRPPPTLTMLGAGLGFAWSGVATKLASDDLAYGHVWVAVAWGVATAAASAIAALSEMSALQRSPAIQVAPVVFVIQTAVPVALAPILLGEHFTETPLSGAPLAASLAVLIAGAAVLARSPLLLALMAGGRAGETGGRAGETGEPVDEIGGPVNEAGQRTSAASGSADSRSAPSHETIRSTPETEAADPSTATTSTSPARVGR